MVSEQSLDAVFHALSDPTRRAMLRALADGEHNIGELAQPFDMSFPAASKHVRVLEQAGLVRREVRGRSHICKLAPETLADASSWFAFYEQFWGERFDALDALFRQGKASKQ
jgi:DNA-binding transcriptional ArsR family regulator